MIIHYAEEKNRKDFVQNVLEHHSLDLASKKNIFIKPNIVSRDPYPATTHPDLLEALIIALKSTGKNIFVADGPSLDRGKEMLKKTDLHGVCVRHDIPLFHFKTFKTKTIQSPGSEYSYRIYEAPFEYDYLISLPVLKTHKLSDVMMTCALKNQFAFFASFNRLKLHLLHHVNQAIADINALVKPDLFMVDALEVLIHANEMRYGGVAKKCGIMFSGTDPVALDSYAFTLLKQTGETKMADKTVRDIAYIALAERQGLGAIQYALEKL